MLVYTLDGIVGGAGGTIQIWREWEGIYNTMYYFVYSIAGSIDNIKTFYLEEGQRAIDGLGKLVNYLSLRHRMNESWFERSTTLLWVGVGEQYKSGKVQYNVLNFVFFIALQD